MPINGTALGRFIYKVRFEHRGGAVKASPDAEEFSNL